MECPVCSDPLMVIERHGIELDYCMNCKGFWFDVGELNLLQEVLDLKVDLPDFASIPEVESQRKPRSCPRCRKKMEQISLGMESQFLIDRCPKGDGLWFDAGELGRIIGQHLVKAESGKPKLLTFLGEFLFSKK